MSTKSGTPPEHREPVLHLPQRLEPITNEGKHDPAMDSEHKMQRWAAMHQWLQQLNASKQEIDSHQRHLRPEIRPWRTDLASSANQADLVRSPADLTPSRQ
ncbi:hypothetical protein ACLOJK_019108 [Asimina triloba]